MRIQHAIDAPAIRRQAKKRRQRQCNAFPIANIRQPAQDEIRLAVQREGVSFVSRPAAAAGLVAIVSATGRHRAPASFTRAPATSQQKLPQSGQTANQPSDPSLQNNGCPCEPPKRR